MAFRPSSATKTGLEMAAFLSARCMKKTSSSLSSTRRIGLGEVTCFVETQPEAATFAKFRSQADGATHALDGFADDGESNAGAFILFAGMDAAENLENVLKVFRRYADAVVLEQDFDAF